MIFELIYYGLIMCFIKWLFSLTQNPNKVDPTKREPVKKNVIVIGGGVSGIVSTKELLADGHTVRVFEKSNCFGGVWKFEAKQADLGGVRDRAATADSLSGQIWQDLITTSSTSVTSFSDYYPKVEKMPREMATVKQHISHPFHMSGQQYYEYLCGYMETFGVTQSHFNFGWKIESTKLNPDQTWSVHMSKTTDEKETRVEIADWVVVSTGQHQVVNRTQIPGIENFKGEVVHSSNYINAKPYTNKNVLIVGGGDSGADIVKHVADVANNVYVSLRHGAHITPRYFDTDTHPIDYAMYRMSFYLPHFVRLFFRDRGIKGHFDRVIATKDCPTTKQVVRVLNLNGLSEESYFTTKSEMLCEAFAKGSGPGGATLVTGIKTMTERGAILEAKGDNPNAGDDQEIKDVDFVINSTGFNQVFPFLPEPYKEHKHLSRYRLVFHPELPHMAFVGFARPSGLGAIPPMAEMQARWMAAVVGERVDLPSKYNMKLMASKVKQLFYQVRKFHNESLVTYAYYAQSLAAQIGAQPHMFDILMKDPQFWWTLLWHPFTMQQFRLYGLNAKYDTAKDIICKISYPTEKGPTPLKRSNPVVMFLMAAVFGTLSQIPIVGEQFQPGIFRYVSGEGY